MGSIEPAPEEACSPPRRREPPFRPPRPTGSGQASGRDSQPHPTAPVHAPRELGRGVSRFFSRAAPAAELQAENAALGDQLADQLARPRVAVIPVAREEAAEAPAPAAVAMTEARRGPLSAHEGKLLCTPKL